MAWSRSNIAESKSSSRPHPDRVKECFDRETSSAAPGEGTACGCPCQYRRQSFGVRSKQEIDRR